ncbi:MAG: hypothetical protein JKY42_04935 [Flavobacteriales bacterium]|nr:hypothetical protein [Flavobacteriales bacterium]
MKWKNNSLFGIIVLSLLIVSCSKEKKIKRQLIGTWTATEIVTITTINSDSPSTDTDNSETNATFEKDGTGTAPGSGSGTNPFPKDFTWTNADETLSIYDTDDETSTIYDVLEHSKKEIVLNTIKTEIISGDTYTNDITITMNISD